MTKNNTLYSNNSRTTLTATIQATDVTIPVASTAGFPTISSATDYFYITLDDEVNVEIVKVTGISGNSFTGCQRHQEGTTARVYGPGSKVENRLTAGSISSFARKTDRLSDYVSVDDIPPAGSADGNSVACSAGDVNGLPVIGLVTPSSTWRFLNYPDIVMTGTVGSGSTTASINLSGASTILTDTRSKAYVIQFTSGTEQGKCRYITSIASGAIAWSTVLSTAPGASDTFHIVRGAPIRVPTGGGSDRVFYENDNTVNSSYTIPAGRNAVSAGPVTVQAGVTVTVPVGSSWSIV